MLTRRAMLRAAVGARGREGFEQQRPRERKGGGRQGGNSGFGRPQPGDVIISGNENPLGPGPGALDALLGRLDESGRYPMNSTVTDADVTKALADRFGARPENIVLGAGSGEILRSTVRAYTSDQRHLVTASPSYNSPVATARNIGTEIKAVPVDERLGLDLKAMTSAARESGVVFFCNPNNPTATVHGKAAVTGFIDEVHKGSADTVVLVDEAYHDYVTDPSYESAISLALERENVIVSRTFSKAYGMAGLRLGYAIGSENTLERLRGFKLTFNTNVLVMAAAIASLADEDYIPNERERNREAREYTLNFFEQANVPASESQTNFIFIELGYPAEKFRTACADQGVHVGRDFPPLEKTHCRISIGTMAEMKKATEVFSKVLKEVV